MKKELFTHKNSFGNEVHIKSTEAYDILDPTLRVHRPVIDLFARNSTCELALLDVINNQFLYYWSRLDCSDFECLKPNFCQTFGIDFLIQRMEPHDAVFALDTKTQSLEYLIQQPVDRRSNFRLTLDFCMKLTNNCYARMIHHSTPFITSEDGSSWIVMFQLNLISATQNYTPPMHALYDFKNRKHVLFSTQDEHTIYFTKKESQTLKLYAEGLIVKEIADRLQVSQSTTNHHLYECKKRMHFSTIGYMVHYYDYLGFI